MYLSKKEIYGKITSTYLMVALWDLRYILKGILPANQSFQFGDRLILFQICLLSSGEEIHVSLQKKSVFEAAAPITSFSCENLLVF
jgi:hypothetical protein